ncbi:hypothetical protein [Prosthecomicrobium sp. N25]|uniref:hypothetical protein n=1 Tax=Prosthecomicrobium sp. N25 TaxID=3129254 RepID=UPI003076BFA2
MLRRSLAVLIALGFATGLSPASAQTAPNLAGTASGQNVGSVTSLKNWVWSSGFFSGLTVGAKYSFDFGTFFTNAGSNADNATSAFVGFTLSPASPLNLPANRANPPVAGSPGGFVSAAQTVFGHALTFVASGATQYIAIGVYARDTKFTAEGTGADRTLGFGNLSVSEVPGPVAGAGLPLVAAAAGYLAWRRRRGQSVRG